MTKDILEDLKGDNRLINHVIDYYINNGDDYESAENLLASMEDLQKNGCVSGMINELMYYDDTNKFYDNYKEEINNILSNLTQETGCSVEDLFGDKFDKDDPLILDYQNKNLLAWFGFEETSYNLYEEIKEKLKNQELEFDF